MKRIWCILLFVLLTVYLYGCGAQESTYTVNRNGIEFLVDSAQKTVTAGTNTYRYEFTGNTSSFKVTVFYPDGSSYWYSQSGVTGQGGWSADYVEGVYISGDILVDVLQEQAPASPNPGKTIGAISVIALGLLYSICPNVFWDLRYGWQFKNAEPSEAALQFARIGGIAAVVIGVVLLIT